ncbi:hypothetical protein [Methanococcus maripaludis]|jgi:hypothetical protein|nr:hypothetical protein [Methanococcus maripaludis]MBA2846106.1 hypothetical protein [Methanococcus maripaludis]MBA2851339.1 hypothetical protein [Methanococcus maripaludis]MBA2858897.1 hypothetical protein [Methanococcus maripaludis]MBB6068058.1 hypothetical protein [Methanococcus maripaludis]MBM7410048.1 hypothetical protein [Methanococcus maripaludis]
MNQDEKQFKKILLDSLFISCIIIAIPAILCLFGAGHCTLGLFFGAILTFLVGIMVLFRKDEIISLILGGRRRYHIKKLKSED